MREGISRVLREQGTANVQPPEGSVLVVYKGGPPLVRYGREVHTRSACIETAELGLRRPKKVHSI